MLWRKQFGDNAGNSKDIVVTLIFKETDQTFLNVWDSRYFRKRTSSEREIAGSRDGFGQVLGPECRRGGRQRCGAEVTRLSHNYYALKVSSSFALFHCLGLSLSPLPRSRSLCLFLSAPHLLPRPLALALALGQAGRGSQGTLTPQLTLEFLKRLGRFVSLSLLLHRTLFGRKNNRVASDASPLSPWPSQ